MLSFSVVINKASLAIFSVCSFSSSCVHFVYIAVVSNLAWPRIADTLSSDTPLSSSCLAKVGRMTCGVRLSLVLSAYLLTIFWTALVVMWLLGLAPGNR